MCKHASVLLETGCAIGTESKDVEEGQERKLASVGGWGGLMIQLLPGDHRAGLRLTGGGGGGAELREAAVTRLQAGHRTPEGRNKRSRENMSEHELHIYATPEHPPSASD